MGIALGFLELLFVEGKRRPFEGKIATLGDQDVWFSYEELVERAEQRDFNLSVPKSGVRLNDRQFYRERGFINQKSLFEALGFDEVYSIDNSDFEGCAFVVDLNSTETPPELFNRFDLVLDGGTLEHVFHTSNALSRIHDMVKTGGRIVHINPTSNLMDHGFCSFSPTLYADYYTTNAYSINRLCAVKVPPNHNTEPWWVAEYDRAEFGQISLGKSGSDPINTFGVFTKSEKSTSGKVPQQGLYVRLWSPVAEIEERIQRKIRAYASPR